MSSVQAKQLSGAICRFANFVLDRSAYRLFKDGETVTTTPQLFDLLVFLVERAGSLVTKEELLNGLWPNANVTENALARAVSELREILGDNARDPQFIKTVARRGYRFIAAVQSIAVQPAVSSSSRILSEGQESPPVVAVLNFANLTNDDTFAWLELGIPETVSSTLRTVGHFRVVNRSRVIETIHTGKTAHDAIAAALGARLLLVGAFQHTAGSLRITARLVEAQTDEAIAEAKADGALKDVFVLQDAIADQLVDAFSPSPRRVPIRLAPRETANLDAYRAWTEGWLKIESLDVRELQRARDDFREAIRFDPRYASAYAGLASVEFAMYESTRCDPEPDDVVLASAERHARHAVDLDPDLAEAHATLAMVLAASWRTPQAVASAARAVTLEPGQWRHLFRLCHASWGEQRLEAAGRTLALYPTFAFAHFQTAMVYVARGQLARAETVLLEGVDVQDRQFHRGERFPALGLHWLLGLVRLVKDDTAGALVEFERERELAHPHRLYGREYQMEASLGRGFALLRAGETNQAREEFERARALYALMPGCRVAQAMAMRSLGDPSAAESLLSDAE